MTTRCRFLSLRRIQLHRFFTQITRKYNICLEISVFCFLDIFQMHYLSKQMYFIAFIFSSVLIYNYNVNIFECIWDKSFGLQLLISLWFSIMFFQETLLNNSLIVHGLLAFISFQTGARKIQLPGANIYVQEFSVVKIKSQGSNNVTMTSK